MVMNLIADGKSCVKLKKLGHSSSITRQDLLFIISFILSGQMLQCVIYKYQMYKR